MANWLRGQDLNLRSPAYETGEDDRAPLPRHEEKARRDLKVCALDGSWHGPMAGSRARNEWAGTGRLTWSAPADRLLSPGRRHDAQATAVREEVEQPRGIGGRGASFGSLQKNEIIWQNLTIRDFGNSAHLLRPRHALAVHPFADARRRDVANELSHALRRNRVTLEVRCQLHTQQLPKLCNFDNPKMWRDTKRGF